MHKFNLEIWAKNKWVCYKPLLDAKEAEDLYLELVHFGYMARIVKSTIEEVSTEIDRRIAQHVALSEIKIAAMDAHITKVNAHIAKVKAYFEKYPPKKKI